MSKYSIELPLLVTHSHDPQQPPVSTGDSPILAGRVQVGLAQSFTGPLFVCLFFPEPQCEHDFACTILEWSFCFSQSCGIPAIKPLCLSKRFRVGTPLLPDPQAGKLDVGLRTFTPLVELLWYNFFPVFQSPTQWVWNLTLSQCIPSYTFIVTSSLLLDVGYLFQQIPAFFFFFGQ